MISFNYGDCVQLVDSKQRRYTITLEKGQEFQNHRGNVSHDEITKTTPGKYVESTGGQRFFVHKPTLSEFVIGMPRGAQIIYPKDIGAILMLADVGPGDYIFESGVGSGALSTALLRVGAKIHGYEIREDFASRARNNVKKFLGEEFLSNYNVEINDSYQAVPSETFDKAILDLPEPWLVIPHLQSRLRPGGIFISYSPSITQVINVHEKLKEFSFTDIEVTEVLHRSWYIKEKSVRPDHRMVAHTGFLVRARV